LRNTVVSTPFSHETEAKTLKVFFKYGRRLDKTKRETKLSHRLAEISIAVMCQCMDMSSFRTQCV